MILIVKPTNLGLRYTSLIYFSLDLCFQIRETSYISGERIKVPFIYSNIHWTICLISDFLISLAPLVVYYKLSTKESEKVYIYQLGIILLEVPINSIWNRKCETSCKNDKTLYYLNTQYCCSSNRRIFVSKEGYGSGDIIYSSVR